MTINDLQEFIDVQATRLEELHTVLAADLPKDAEKEYHDGLNYKENPWIAKEAWPLLRCA
jgi:hypothetical protein